MSSSMSLEDYRALTRKGVVSNFDRRKGKSKTKEKKDTPTPYDKGSLLKNKPSKYKAQKVIINGITFDSKIESQRYLFLKEQQRKRLISELTLQETFEIEINEEHICSYQADFSYINKYGEKIVEDVKGVKTPVYRLKKKMMAAYYGIKIKEIGIASISSL